MKIIIDLEDVWADEDETIKEAIASRIIYEVVQKMKEEYKEQIDKQIIAKVDEFMEDGAIKYIDSVLSTIITKDMKVKPTYHSEEIPLLDFIK